MVQKSVQKVLASVQRLFADSEYTQLANDRAVFRRQIRQRARYSADAMPLEYALVPSAHRYLFIRMIADRKLDRFRSFHTEGEVDEAVIELRGTMLFHVPDQFVKQTTPPLIPSPRGWISLFPPRPAVSPHLESFSAVPLPMTLGSFDGTTPVETKGSTDEHGGKISEQIRRFEVSAQIITRTISFGEIDRACALLTRERPLTSSECSPDDDPWQLVFCDDREIIGEIRAYTLWKRLNSATTGETASVLEKAYQACNLMLRNSQCFVQ